MAGGFGQVDIIAPVVDEDSGSKNAGSLRHAQGLVVVGSRTEVEMMFTIRPYPCSVMIGTAADVQKNTAFRFVWMTSTHCSSVIFRSDESRVMPALFTSASRRPN